MNADFIIVAINSYLIHFATWIFISWKFSKNWNLSPCKTFVRLQRIKIEHFSPIIDKTTVAYQHAKEREWFFVVLDFVAFNLKDCNYVHYIHVTFYKMKIIKMKSLLHTRLFLYYQINRIYGIFLIDDKAQKYQKKE